MDQTEHRTFEESISAIRDFEILTESQFVLTRRTKRFSNSYVPSASDLKSQRIRFGGTDSIVGPLKQVPFLIVGSCDFSCVYGKGRKQKVRKGNTEEEHSYDLKKRGKCRPTSSKKQGCPFILKVQEVLEFTEYGEQTTKRKQRNISKEIKSGASLPNFSRKFIVKAKHEHADHIKGKVSGIGRNVSKDIIGKIKELVASGVVRTEEIRREIERYVDTLPLKKKPSKLNEQYYPSTKTIYNHIQLALAENRYSVEEQCNIHHHLQMLSTTFPGLQFFFRQHNEEKGEKLLIVLQCEWQRKLIERFGKCTLLDSTFGTSKYQLPLYEVVIHTNVGYSPVAIIITEDEKQDSIESGLQVLKSWNPTWNPNHIVTDCDIAQTIALQQVFPDSSHILCKFHVIQCWKRWLSRADNGLTEEKDEILLQLKALASSLTKDQFQSKLEELKQTNVWKENIHFQNYVTNTWLSIAEKWVRAFRSLDENIVVTTTNGVEVHHRILKSTLKEFSCKSGQGLVDVIITKYFDQCLKSYIRKNVLSLTAARLYRGSVPEFLLQKSTTFMEHCMSRLPDAMVIEESDITRKGHHLFTVKSQSDSIGETVYSVNFEIASCDCCDFQLNYMPCKHMISVILQYDAWEILPKEYVSCSYFSVNEAFLKWINSMPEETPIESHAATYTCLDRKKYLHNETCLQPTIDTVKKDIRRNANIALNNMKNFINNATDEEAIRRASSALENLYSQLVEEFGKANSHTFSSKSTPAKRLQRGRTEVPFSFLKRGLKRRKKTIYQSGTGKKKRVTLTSKRKPPKVKKVVSEVQLPQQLPESEQKFNDDDVPWIENTVPQEQPHSHPDAVAPNASYVGENVQNVSKHPEQKSDPQELSDDDLPETFRKGENTVPQEQPHSHPDAVAPNASYVGENVQNVSKHPEQKSDPQELSDDDLPETFRKGENGSDSDFDLTEDEMYKKVPFNPDFKIPIPEYAEVNPYNPNLLRLKIRRKPDKEVKSDDFEYKPRRKIRFSKSKQTVPQEQPHSHPDAVAPNASYVGENVQNVSKHPEQKSDPQELSDDDLPETFRKGENGSDSDFDLTEDEMYKKVPFNPDFKIPIPEYAEVNPYNPNLLRLKIRRKPDKEVKSDDFEYKPRRKIRFSKSKQTVPQEQPHSHPDAVAPNASYVGENVQNVSKHPEQKSDPQELSDDDLPETFRKGENGSDSDFDLTEDEMYKKVPFNPDFKIPIPEYAEVNPYNPNLLRLKIRRKPDKEVKSDDFEYKPRRKIRFSKSKQTVPQEQPHSHPDAVAPNASYVGENVQNVSKHPEQKSDPQELSDDDLPETSRKGENKKNAVIDLSCEDSDDDVALDSESISVKDPIIPDVDLIWNKHHTSKSLMAIVGQYKLYGYSFGSLRSGKEVSDEIIDAYMQVLVDHHPHTMFIDCVVAGKLLQYPNSCALMIKTSFELYNVVLCPFNMFAHWELLVIFPKKKKLLYLNPVGELVKREKEMLKSWKTFMNRRWASGLEKEGPSKWQLMEKQRHSRQTDAVSCGVFIMKFAELILQDKPLYFKSRAMDITRKEIASLLLCCCGNVTNFCRACSRAYNPSAGWIQCNSCLWWHHFECSGILDSFEEAGRNSFKFECKTCKGNDAPTRQEELPELRKPRHEELPEQRKPRHEELPELRKPRHEELPELRKPRREELPELRKPRHEELPELRKPQERIDSSQADVTSMPKQVTVEPFVICKLRNIIKICAGCRTKFKKPVKTPNDLVIRHREIDSFFDKNLGKMRKVFSNKYYHISANCIKSRNPTFVRSSICLPPDIMLSDDHLAFYKNHGFDLESFVNRKM